jgi:hypothetical protein
MCNVYRYMAEIITKTMEDQMAASQARVGTVHVMFAVTRPVWSPYEPS